MRRWIAWIFVTGLFSTASAAAGDSLPAQSLLSKCNAIRLELVLGRIMVIPMHRGQLRVTTPESKAVRELLVVNNAAQPPMVRYERIDGQCSLTVEILNYRDVHILQETATDGTPEIVEYHQPAEGNVQLAIRKDEQQSKLQSRSLWHLMFSDRKLCEQVLVPILETLRPDWQLARTSEQLESNLFHSVLSEPVMSRHYLGDLVKQLDAPQFSRRQMAENHLRSHGPAILPYLDSLKNPSLTREQLARVRRIRDSIAASSPDSSDRTAQWLSDDEQIWFSLLKHDDPQRRHVAAIRLTAMRSDSLEFDPYADESYRQEQLAQLQSRISRR